MDLSTTLCGKKMKNPLVLASGILDVTAASMLRVVKEGGAGAVTCKSTNVEGKKGHPNPVLLTDPHWVMNAVGLSNPGIEETRGEIEVYKKKEKTAPILLSIFAKTVKDYAEITREADRTEADLIEVNISCPNVEDEFGRPFALDPKIAAAVTKIVRKNTQKKVLVKLSPQAGSIAEVAKACEQAGADGITAINTVGPGMAISLEARKPTLANLRGGISGPAIKPVAVRCIYDIYKAVKIPILGMGGVMTGEDALEMILAGATAVGVGSAIYYRGIDVFKKITKEMKEWGVKNKVKKLKGLVGAANK